MQRIKDQGAVMDTKTFVIEALKALATMVVPLIALLRTRTDLDRFAAAQRAKETGTSMESQIRKRWYHAFSEKRVAPPESKS